jgi:hypothetical protein
MLETLFDTYKNTKLYNSHESSGPSLLDALERYKRYERQLRDNVRANEETLKRLGNQPSAAQFFHQQQQQQNLKTNFNMFPNANRSGSSDRNSNEETTTMTSHDRAGSKSATGYLNGRKNLPPVTNVNGGGAGSSLHRSSSGKLTRNLKENVVDDQVDDQHVTIENDDDFDDDDDNDDDDDVDLEINNDAESSISDSEPTQTDRDKKKEQQQQQQSSELMSKLNSPDVKYDLELIIKLLNEGFYLR